MIDTFTTNHLHAWLHSSNPTNIDDADLAETIIAWLESMQQEDQDYWISRGWSAVCDQALREHK